MAKRSFYVKDTELDDYQFKVINKKTDNSYIVKGCAGSGKSILALWKAKQIQDEQKKHKNACFVNKKYLILCDNYFLTLKFQDYEEGSFTGSISCSCCNDQLRR